MCDALRAKAFRPDNSEFVNKILMRKTNDWKKISVEIIKFEVDHSEILNFFAKFLVIFCDNNMDYVRVILSLMEDELKNEKLHTNECLLKNKVHEKLLFLVIQSICVEMQIIKMKKEFSVQNISHKNIGAIKYQIYEIVLERIGEVKQIIDPPQSTAGTSSSSSSRSSVVSSPNVTGFSSPSHNVVASNFGKMIIHFVFNLIVESFY